MDAPINAELAAWTSTNTLGSLHIRLLAMKVAKNELEAIAANLIAVKDLWSGTAAKASSVQTAIAANEWASLERLEGPNNLTIYKYFCGPRIYLNPKLSDLLEVPYTDNDGLVKVVHTYSLQTYVATVGGWDAASSAFIERQRGLELVGMGYGWWLVTSEEQNLN